MHSKRAAPRKPLVAELAYEGLDSRVLHLSRQRREGDPTSWSFRCALSMKDLLQCEHTKFFFFFVFIMMQ